MRGRKRLVDPWKIQLVSSTLSLKQSSAQGDISYLQQLHVVSRSLGCTLWIPSKQEFRLNIPSRSVSRDFTVRSLHSDIVTWTLELNKDSQKSLNTHTKGGVTGSLVGQVPYGVLVFGSYEVYKQELIARFPNANPMFIFSAASLLGDLTGSFCLCPSEVIKQKMQAGMFRNEREALVSIWRSRGPLGFYEGYTGGLVRDVPFRVAQLVSWLILMTDIYPHVTQTVECGLLIRFPFRQPTNWQNDFTWNWKPIVVEKYQMIVLTWRYPLGNLLRVERLRDQFQLPLPAH